MGRVLPIVIIAMLMIYAIVEVAQADPLRVRVMPRWLWAVAVILLPGAGALAWLVFGRPTRGSGRQSPPPKAPDDDPDFLRRL
ncbi:MAG: PLDc N-terminal domain-containing protein [Propionicimonas sp.]|nr:PLDc N-terminal domain-containing protein [Propionicimonas sp.]